MPVWTEKTSGQSLRVRIRCHRNCLYFCLASLFLFLLAGCRESCMDVATLYHNVHADVESYRLKTLKVQGVVSQVDNQIGIADFYGSDNSISVGASFDAPNALPGVKPGDTICFEGTIGGFSLTSPDMVLLQHCTLSR